MAPIDYILIVLYFVIVIGLGVWTRRRASKDLKAYFLAGHGMHWLTLAMSGSVSNFDITGTMWIVSVIFLLGMKSMWHHWMWGFLMGAFFFSYMGRWVRRSNVMTAAEWMKTRFGDGPAGKLARTAYAIMAVVTLAGFVGYAYQGIGKFASVYIPLESLADKTSSPWLQSLVTTHEAAVLALLIIGLTTVYVIMGGLFSVVITNVIQTIVLTIGCLVIAGIAWAKMTPELLARLPDGFASLAVPWHIPKFAHSPDHALFHCFGAIVILWVVKGLLLNAGGPGQMYDFQLFLSAKDEKEASKVGAAWSFFLIVRWAMAMGIALLALTGLTGGVTDSEKVMPIVLTQFLPLGLRGLVTAGLLAAFMSTFAATVNSGASFIVRDLVQPFWPGTVTDRQAVRWGHWATFALVLLGLGIGASSTSIAEIWGWIMMVLGGSVIIPNVLRWHWWRLNGWGYGIGMLGGVLLSAVAPRISDSILVQFPLVSIGALVFCVIGTYATQPTAQTVLEDFYRTVRPFGFWGPVRSAVPEAERTPRESFGLTVLNVVLGMITIATIYIAPMYLVGHWYAYAGICAAIAAVCMGVLKFTWYERLAGRGERDEGRGFEGREGE